MTLFAYLPTSEEQFVYLIYFHIQQQSRDRLQLGGRLTIYQSALTVSGDVYTVLQLAGVYN